MSFHCRDGRVPTRVTKVTRSSSKSPLSHVYATLGSTPRELTPKWLLCCLTVLGVFRAFLVGRLIFIHLQCWEVLPFCGLQRQRCIKILCPKDPDFYTPLALKTAKGQHLPALEVYKKQSPTSTIFEENFLLQQEAVFSTFSIVFQRFAFWG